MSTIDERIVSMRFDNRQFQNGVSDSLNSISKLKSGLNFSGASKGLDDIGASASKVNFGGMSSGLEAVQIKFSALQVVAVTALSNIANSAINTGTALLKSLTIDPIADGYADYGRKLTSIQTITNATGKSIQEVNTYFNTLDEYADKTIYNLDDMTSAFAKFTNAGVDLDKSVPAIKGIANMVALAGQDAGAAQIAMYNLSQSIAGGFLTTMDYKSLNLANVATKEWKDQMIAGAIAAGTLTKSTDGMYMIKGGKEAVTGAALFTEELSKGWATTNVLLDVLGKYGDTNTEIGKKAQAAAQDVKSFSMMMDTLKAAAGTGWTDTFEILVGDLKEAKDLFTPLTATIGGFLDASAKARNELLSGWKELGGRTVLIDAIKSAFNNVMDVVNALGLAFRDVFPATTSAQLFSLTEGLKSLIDSLKLSDGMLYNLRSTFKGVFAILDIGKTLFLALANAISIMLGGTGNLASSILGVTASFGEWFTALDNSIKKSDIFNKVLTTLAYGIRNGFNSIAYVFDIVVKGISSVAKAIGERFTFPGFETLYAFLDLMGKRITSIGDEANTMSTTVAGAFLAMGKAIIDSRIGDVFTSIWNTFKTVGNAIGTMIGNLADAITTSIKNTNFSSLLDAMGALSIGGMFLAFNKFMKGLKEPFSNATSFFDQIKAAFSNITGILDDVRGSFEAYQQNLKAGILIKLAVAIGILAASIVAISLVDSAKLVSSLAAIGTLFGQLLVSMKLFSMIGQFQKGIIKAGIVMLAMSTSILILSNAMKNIASLDWNGVAKGLVGVGVLAGMLVATAKILSNGSGAMIKGSAGMVVFAVAIKILASACIDLSNLSWEQLAKGLVGVGVLMAEISLFLNTAKFSAKTILTATGIVILAAAMKILASACSDFGKLSWSDIGKGLTSIGVLLAEMAVFSNVTANSKNVISTSIALIAVGVAMKILASAMADFATISWESIAKGLVVMGVALAEITIAANLLPKDLPTKAVGLVIMGAALKIIASALQDMGGMSWESITKGLVAMGGSLGILSIGLKSMSGSLTGSAALLIAAAALAILAPTLVLLGSMTWESIIKGLVDLGATIAIFGIAAAVLTPVIPSMLALSGSLVLLGVAMLGIGAGLALVGIGLAGIATGFTLLAGTTAAGATAIVAALGIIIVGVAALIPAVMAKIGEGILAFIKVLADSIPAICACLTTIIKAIVDCIVTNVPVIVQGVLTTLSAILGALVQWIPTIGQQVMDIILALLKILGDNIGKFVVAGVNIVLGFIKGVAESIGKIIQAATDLIIAFINGLADSINKNSTAMADACGNLIEAFVKAIGTFIWKAVDVGKNVVTGFIKGITDGAGAVWDAGVAMGKKALDAVADAIDSNSPSKEFAKLGSYGGQGFVNGLDSYGKKVYAAGTNMGTGAVDAMSNAIAGISDIVNSDITSQPVITPVLDLTNIQNGSNQIYGMMNKLDNCGIDGSITSVNSTAKSISNRQLLSDDTIASGSIKSGSVNSQTASKQPVSLQLILQNGKTIAEYLVDDMDTLLGNKNIIAGRMIGS